MKHQHESDVLTLKLLGFSDADKIRFSSILTLAERMLNKNWSITNDMSADFFLIKETLRPLMDEHEALKSLPPRQCIFTGSKQDSGETAGHRFYWGESHIPSLRLLADFLNRLTFDKSVANPSAGQTLMGSGPDYFDPEQGFLGYLLDSSKEIRAFKLNEHAEISLYVDIEQNCYYSNTGLEQLKPYFSAADNLLIENLNMQQLQAIAAEQALKPQPLSHLLWFTAFTCSEGKVIKGYQKGDIVYLKRWPNINLPGCKQLIKLAAYMQSNAVDLDTVQVGTSIPIARIYDFYNACKVTGLIVHSQTVDIHEKNIDIEQKQLFARIGRRLNKTT